MKALRMIMLACTLALAPALVFGANKININTAPASVLQQLDRIGPTKAQAIVDYREHNGDFKTLEDLTKVHGIGEQTLDANR
ncbi:MAG TPA: helix-hairpin-helix domain-containing protein, partial [Nitrococcus sp.]|nr:helix-hairpin-helix domain-containing protein [Nitrococcus sp.]